MLCAYGPAGRTLQFFSNDSRLYHASGSQLLACHCGGPGSIPGQSCLGFVVDKVALEWVFLPVLQFSPVTIILPLLHTHSFIYHPRCVMFFSQHFSFSLSVTFHHHSIPFGIFMLPSPEDQNGRVCGPSKQRCCSSVLYHFMVVYSHFF